MIGGDLSDEGKKAIYEVLKANLDVFDWKSANMTGVPRTLAEHKLGVKDLTSQTKKRGQAPKGSKVINEEVQKLVKDGIIREVTYHSWISNLVLVKKHDESWRMCVDITNLNKAYPKDYAYKGYPQIQMTEEDEEKTAFHTSQGVLCYIKMPFRLKNVGATYQRLVDKAFNRQIERHLEVYVNDLVIKSHSEKEVVRDIQEAFHTLRKINTKLNLKKCTFEGKKGLFIGPAISKDDIQDYSEKTQAVINMPSPRTLKEDQSLNGKLESLNRFVTPSNLSTQWNVEYPRVLHLRINSTRSENDY
ncbi:reverse transcriptase domain-containing protein [Tanacetum coccineum]